MLRGNDGPSNLTTTACSLTSCRIKAETLARALNSRIWPCTWAEQRRTTNDGDEEDEEYFETSPSPIEEGDDQRGRNSSAATAEGRAKLYELLQQHADDASDVYYDVSEHACASETDCETQQHLPQEEEDTLREVTAREAADGCWESCQNGQTDSCELPSTPSNSPTMKSNSVIGDVMKTSSLDGEDLSGTDLDPDSSLLLIECEQNSTSVERKPSPEQSESYISNCTESATHSNQSQSKCVQNSSMSEICYCPKTSESSSPSGFEPATDSNIHQIEYVQNSTMSESYSSPERSESSIHNGFGPILNSSLSQLECETVLENSTEIEKSPSSELSESCVPNGCEPEDEIVIQITNDHSQGNSPKVLSPDNTSPSGSCRLTVFTDLRPMITRSTSLKTGKTPPGTPSRKKIVRFADVLGLDLEDVRHIISGDLPTVPPSAYDDLVLADKDLPAEVPSHPTLELKGRQQGTWDNVTTVTVPNALYPKFPIPGQQPDFMDRVRSQGVCLENVVITEFSVQGTCRVMNWDFDKRVVVRYSTNGWASVSDINASYVSGSTIDNTDSFAFNLFLAPSNGCVEFAVRFEVNGKEYWDNNRGGNYRISRQGNEGTTHAVSAPCSPTWMHQFW